jgi:hypothetical protein
MTLAPRLFAMSFQSCSLRALGNESGELHARRSILESRVMTEHGREIAQRLVGAWDLVDWSEIRQDGSRVFPLGERAIGQLVYTTDGHVAAQLVAVPRTRFQSDDWRVASEVEAARAFKEYFGYFGRFTVDPNSGIVIHHIKGGWFPNLEGNLQVRLFHFERELLVLEAEAAWGRVRIVWTRSLRAAIAE